MTYSEHTQDTGSIYRKLSAREIFTQAGHAALTDHVVTIEVDEIGPNRSLPYLVVRKGDNYLAHVELDHEAWEQFKASIVREATPF